MMKKMNLRKMVIAAAMAAFMVYAPAMAEEDIILEDETVEMAEETALDTLETGADEMVLDLVAVEEISEDEIPEEVAQAAELAGDGTEGKVFFFENEEVIVRAETMAELPENVQMVITKLEAGSQAYEEARQAAVQACGTDDGAEYSFYDVTFVADGIVIEPADGSVQVQIEFRNVQENATVLHIDENGAAAQDGTASMSFAM